MLSIYRRRDLAVLLIRHIDYESQLTAIKKLLDQNREEEERLNSEIDDSESDDRGEKCHRSVYQGATHSMAAVGMLTPFFESIFQQAFLGLQAFVQDGLPGTGN